VTPFRRRDGLANRNGSAEKMTPSAKTPGIALRKIANKNQEADQNTVIVIATSWLVVLFG
jgi:hypothetical protein